MYYSSLHGLLLLFVVFYDAIVDVCIMLSPNKEEVLTSSICLTLLYMLFIMPFDPFFITIAVLALYSSISIIQDYIEY